MKIESIVIRDGMASIEDSAGNGDACNLEATLAAFVEETKAELALAYPGVEVSYQWVNSDQGLKVESINGDYNIDQYDTIVASIQYIAEYVWERGSFWVAA